jgi:hypothetical protein
MSRTPTLPSRQRGRVLEAYRGRGHRNSNLWLVYSVKQDQDLLLHSDRSLVHWLTFLESDSSVVGFRPINEEVSALLKVGPAAAMVLERKNHQLEVHVVAANSPGVPTVETGVGIATVRVITCDELQTRSRLALRWLKAIGYAGLFRYQDMTPVMNQLATVLMRRMTGTLNDLVDDLSGHDHAAIYGAVVKAAIHGHIDLDLASHGLCGTSGWKWNSMHAR